MVAMVVVELEQISICCKLHFKKVTGKETDNEVPSVKPSTTGRPLSRDRANSSAE